MLRRSKRSKIEVVAPEEEEVLSMTGILYTIDRLELKNTLRLREWNLRQIAA
jgi:hypothetical protein